MTRIYQLADGTWEARPYIDGKRPRIHGKTQAEVARNIAQLRDAQHRRRLGLPDPYQRPEDVTFQALCERFFRQYGGTERSERSIRTHLAYALGNDANKGFPKALVRDLTAETLKVWNKNLVMLDGKTPLGMTTKHHAWRSTRQVLNFAVETGLLDKNPMRGNRQPPRPSKRVIHPFESWDEVRRTAAAAGGAHGAMIRFNCATGLRPQEWRALPWEAISIEKRELRVIQAVVSGQIKPIAKTGDSLGRIVRLQQEALDALAELPRPLKGGLVFTAPEGGLIHESNWRRRVWLPALREADLRPRALDQMRHTFATLALAAGWPMEAIARQMGHTSSRMVQKHYAAWLPETDDRLMRLLDAYAQEPDQNPTSGEEATDAR
jgi:integrase